MNLDNTVFNIPVLTREYTITCSNDELNINKGRCPDYALEWSDEQNKLHWPDSHNYLKGLHSPSSSSGLSSPSSSGLHSPSSSGLPSPINNSLDVTRSIDTFLLLFENNEKIKTNNEKIKTNNKKIETNKKKNTYYKLFRKVANKIFEKKEDIVLFCSLEVLVCNIDDDINELNLSKYGKQLWKIIKKFSPFVVVHNKYYTPDLIKWCKFTLETDNITVYSVIKEEEETNKDLASYILIDNMYCDEYKNQIFVQNTNVNETLQKLLPHL